MATEALRPHDCLSRVRHHAHASRRPPRRSARHAAHHAGTGHRRQAAAPREVRVAVAATTTDAAYAGPAFGAMSPSPRALPLPRFSSKAAATEVDDSATRELRRLLGLE